MIETVITAIEEGMGGRLSLVDEDYGQMDSGADAYPVTFPAVLVSVPSAEYSHIADGQCIGDCTLSVRLFIDCYDDTHSGSGTTEKARERQRMAQELCSVLDNRRLSQRVSALLRRSMAMRTDTNGIKEYSFTYSFASYE